MYDLMNAPTVQVQPMFGDVRPATVAASAISARAMARMLDVVDYGMLVVVDETYVVFVNQVARAELDAEHPLQLLGRDLRARCPRDVGALRQALSSAVRRGMQSMLMLGRANGEGVNVAVVPLVEPGEAPAALIIFGKRVVCEDLSTDAFARQHELTSAETRVLKRLCAGSRPQDIAHSLGVKLTTVRTQITSIRVKTGSRDIGGIVHRVARLPPLPCVMRRVA